MAAQFQASETHNLMQQVQIQDLGRKGIPRVCRVPAAPNCAARLAPNQAT